MKHLHNIHSREELIKQRLAEQFDRRTVSFYRYVIIDNPHAISFMKIGIRWE